MHNPVRISMRMSICMSLHMSTRISVCMSILVSTYGDTPACP